MSFQFQKVSDHGTSVPAVARTMVQTHQLLQAFPISKEVRTGVTNALWELKRQLVRCVETSTQIREQVANGTSEVMERGLHTQSDGRVVSVPGVADLQNHAESFLQSSKLAIRDAARVLGPFFDREFNHRFDRILTWAKERFPEDDQLVQCVLRYQPWLTEVLAMRNAVDHPSDKPRGKLVIQNFQLIANHGGPQLSAPSWCLHGDDPTPIVEGMETITEGILCLSEDLLSICLLKNRGAFPLYIYEIPEQDRDPNCPIRLRVGIDHSRPDA